MESPDIGYQNYADDTDGYLISQVDSVGNQVEWVRDGLGRTLEVWETLAGGSLTLIEEYTWDTAFVGKLSSVTDAAGSVSYTYDDFGRRIVETRTYSDGTTATWNRTFDRPDRMTTEEAPDGTVITYIYAYGHLDLVEVQLTNGTTHRIADLDWDDRGSWTGWSSDYGLNVTMDRDDLGRLTLLDWDMNTATMPPTPSIESLTADLLPLGAIPGLLDRVVLVISRGDLAGDGVSIEGPLLVPFVIAIQVDLRSVHRAVPVVLVQVDLVGLARGGILDLSGAQVLSDPRKNEPIDWTPDSWSRR